MKWNPLNVIVTVIVAILVVASVTGGVLLLNDSQSSGERSVTDSMNRTVYVPNDIKTIFCEDCCTLEAVSWFESIDKVCGRDSRDQIAPGKTYTQVFKEKLQSLPVIDVLNAESVIKLNPSIVICSTADSQKISEKQSRYGIPVYYFNADVECDSEEWFTQITKLGALLHEENRAKEIVNGVKAIKNDLAKSNFSDKSAYACGMMYYGPGTYEKTSGNMIPFDWISLNNVMPPHFNKQPYNINAKEKLNATNYDYIFIDGSNIDVTRNGLRDFKNNLCTSDKTAFVNGDIYSTLTYKMWGTQWDNVLLNCYYVKHIVSDDDSLKENVNNVLHLFYGDKVDYDELKSWNPNSFEKQVM